MHCRTIKDSLIIFAVQNTTEDCIYLSKIINNKLNKEVYKTQNLKSLSIENIKKVLTSIKRK